MVLIAPLRNLLCFGIILSLTSSVYLYLYPLFHLCAFPSPNQTHLQSYISTLRQHAGHAPQPNSVAPFRLLALGDPQLEGDTSLPSNILANLPPQPLPLRLFYYLSSLRKTIDLWGNDYYLAHIQRSLSLLTHPTHTVVLGDLLGSQWISDSEFDRRATRYWRKVFPAHTRIPDAFTTINEPLGADPAWRTRLINVVGNHDIGYSGDMTRARVNRFERAFGRANYDVTFTHCAGRIHPTNTTTNEETACPQIRLVVLNNLHIDSPVLDAALQAETYAFLNDVIATSKPVEDKTALTVLLTHVPLHKKEGVCVDPPMVAYYHSSVGGGAVREQNHLTEGAGVGTILRGVFGMSEKEGAVGQGRGRPGVVLTGHDHEGCDTWHHLVAMGASEGEDGEVEKRWDQTKWKYASVLREEGGPGIREITVRSMMGDFGGNAGLLSAWFDEKVGDKGEWRVEFRDCSLGTQHIWWAVHVTILVTVLVGFLYGILCFVEYSLEVKARRVKSEANVRPIAVDSGAQGSPRSIATGIERVIRDKSDGVEVRDTVVKRKGR